MRVFVKNNNQRRGKPLADEDVSTYKDLRAKARIAPVVAHGTRLINLFPIDDAILELSREMSGTRWNAARELRHGGIWVSEWVERCGAGKRTRVFAERSGISGKTSCAGRWTTETVRKPSCTCAERAGSSGKASCEVG